MIAIPYVWLGRALSGDKKLTHRDLSLCRMNQMQHCLCHHCRADARERGRRHEPAQSGALRAVPGGGVRGTGGVLPATRRGIRRLGANAGLCRRGGHPDCVRHSADAQQRTDAAAGHFQIVGRGHRGGRAGVWRAGQGHPVAARLAGTRTARRNRSRPSGKSATN